MPHQYEKRHPRTCTGLVRLFGVHGFGEFGREEPHCRLAAAKETAQEELKQANTTY